MQQCSRAGAALAPHLPAPRACWRLQANQGSDQDLQKLGRALKSFTAGHRLSIHPIWPPWTPPDAARPPRALLSSQSGSKPDPAPPRQV